MYKKVILLLFAVVIIAFIVNSCQDESIPPLSDQTNDGALTSLIEGCYSTPIPTGCINVNINGSLYDTCYYTLNLSNAGTFNGRWRGWCMDLGTHVAATQYNCAHMYSSLEPFPQSLKSSIEGWQDMDKINYLVNHWHRGDQIQRKNYLCQNVGGVGTINTVDFQKAIWRILDVGPGNTYSEFSDSLIVNALVCDMNTNGEGFVPSCTNGDYIVFFLDLGLNPGNGTRCYSTPIPTGCVNVNIQGTLYDSSYFRINLSNAGTFNGVYSGWCMDLGTTHGANQFDCAHMFSSLEPFPEYLKSSIEGWQDMDKINYLINHWHTGMSIQRKNYLCQNVDGLGLINSVSFQKAIWRILDVGPGNTYNEFMDSLVVNALVCDMNANGEGFVPRCSNGDLIVFFIDPGLNPNGTRAQPVFAYAPCCGTNAQPVLAYARCCPTTGGPTSWRDAKYGAGFPDNNWATFFKSYPTYP
jgi:hypothetical protein